MKIMVINPNSSTCMTKHIERVLMGVKRQTTELTVVCPEGGPLAIESAFDEALCVPGVLRLVQQANREGYDAAIVACFSDPGLESAREISDILVTGIEEQSLHVAAMMGAKFSVLTLDAQRVPSRTNDVVGRFQLGSALASVRPIGMSVAEVDAEPARACRQLLETARIAASQDGAEVIVLGCAGMAGYADEITKQLGLTVVDPAPLTLKMTEALVELGVRPSKCGLYAMPPSVRRGEVTLGAHKRDEAI